MGLPKELASGLIKILPRTAVLDKPLTPVKKRIYKSIFSLLKLKKGIRVLDLACGMGAVSIPLAVKYKVYIDGYDILPGFIKYAKQKAKAKGLSHLCKFKVGDVRKVVKEARDYDVILWFSPPHLWNTAKEAIKHLRPCCKDKGYIVIDDAYLYPKAPNKKDYKTYQPLKDMNNGFTYFGDSLIKVFDYKGANWREDYDGDRKIIKRAILRLKNSKDKTLLKEYLKSLNNLEKKDTENLGGAIWVIIVNKLNEQKYL
jgi:ubiquinone/menaquinone biosynthesis C-methylase UbiE